MATIRDLGAHGRLRLTGLDRVRFLNGILTNDVASLKPGEGCHAALLTVKGRTLADMIVYAGESALDLAVDGVLTEKVKATLDRYLIADDAVIEDRSADVGEIGVYGDDAADLLAEVLAVEGLGMPPLRELAPHHFVERGDTRVAAAADLASPGFRVYAVQSSVAEAVERLRERGAVLLDEPGWEVLRVESGRPRYGVDVDEDHLPTEARLEHTISYSKGCFLGQEVIVRLRDQGHLNWRLMGLRLDGAGAAARGSRLSARDRPDAGRLTSSVVSPRFGAIALAYVHRSQWAPDTRLTVADTAGERNAIVVELPFGSTRG